MNFKQKKDYTTIYKKIREIQNLIDFKQAFVYNNLAELLNYQLKNNIYDNNTIKEANTIIKVYNNEYKELKKYEISLLYILEQLKNTENKNKNILQNLFKEYLEAYETLELLKHSIFLEIDKKLYNDVINYITSLIKNYRIIYE